MRKYINSIKNFRNDEGGAGTVWSIFWTIIFLICAGFVIDLSNAYRYRAALQATADSSALAGIVTYYETPKFTIFTGQGDPGNGTDRAKIMAQELARVNMAKERNGTQVNGEVVQQANVLLGNWNGTTFAPAASPTNAVKVTALRTDGNGNKLGTLLLDAFTSFDHWDVGESAVAAMYRPFCYDKPNMIAGHTLNLATQNTFEGEMCLHGELGVDMQPMNSFGDEVQVTSAEYDNLTGLGNDDPQKVIDASLPDDSGIPSLEGNYGADPMMYQSITNLFNNIETTLTALAGTNPDQSADSVAANELLSEYIPGFLKDSNGDLVTYQLKSGTADEFQKFIDGGKGATATPPAMPFTDTNPTVYSVSCNGSGKTITFDNAQTIEGLVLVTDCALHLGSDAVFGNSVLFTTSGKTQKPKQTQCEYTDPDACVPLDPQDSDPNFIGSAAVTASQGATIGSGTCENAKGAKIISRADINFASGMNLMRAQIISTGDIHIAAQPSGFNGSQIMAAQDVFNTSLGEFDGGCPGGPTDAFAPNFYRLVL